MTYNPNMADPRVRNRIQKAFGFARGVLSTDKPHGWSTRYLDRYFGQQQHALSQWLRKHLLICRNPRYSKDAGITKQWCLNAAGADHIRHLLNSDIGTAAAAQQQFDQECVDHWIQKEFGDQVATNQYEYTEKSFRLWHPIQNIRSQYKKPLLAQYGLEYHYDIQCCAPTLIHQHAQRQLEPMDLYLSALRHYLVDRQQVRQELAQAMAIDINTAKVIINALFCGARVGHNPTFDISQLLNHDPARIEYLKQDPYITELRTDIRICWNHIQTSMIRRSIIDKNNRKRMLAITPRDKWMRYFDLERTVLNSVVDYMKVHNIQYFLEHDGWACDRPIDTQQLELHVRESTGYQVVFDSTRISLSGN